MKHPFDGIVPATPSAADSRATTRRSLLRLIAGSLAAVFGFRAAQAVASPVITTRVLGEEGGAATTRALGEEGAAYTSYALGEEGGIITTRALGEEGGGVTTRALGEEGGYVTTQALGEEGGYVTTYAAGEEGGRRKVTTVFLREEG